jgi:uncharacterized cupredoxin-like copper-binding protein
MKISVRKIAMGALLVGAFVLAACGGSSEGSTGGATEIGTDGENLAYSTTSISAAAGSTVTLTFKNGSSAQSHNLVLVNGGADVAAAVDEAALEAGDAAGYVPESADVLAHTGLLAPGASETLTFTAPAAGTYTFICTYPGHYAGGMQGVLTVN